MTGYRAALADGSDVVVKIDGIADTRCIATHASAAAVADRAGNLWLSTDSGQTWVRHAERLPAPSSVLILDALAQ